MQAAPSPELGFTLDSYNKQEHYSYVLMKRLYPFWELASAKTDASFRARPTESRLPLWCAD